jgi:GAF domain-containing protein
LELLAQAIKLDRATRGNIQALAAQTGCLNIIAQVGFDEQFLRHFAAVEAFDASACGRAFGTGNWVMIPDILQDDAFAPHRAVVTSNDVRSVKSVPVIAPDGGIIGMLSTHSPQPRWDWERDNTRNIAAEIGRILAAR